ncbi:MAG: NAD(P)H-dependent oxidoreductase [Dehalococcoidales bacterium]|nr:NAD(P)H-dependent oxidoreductase [Dehalococcoidales bacterium]
MIRITGISGSLRKGSYNTALLKTVTQIMPSDSNLEVELLNEIPLYDADVETSKGIPIPVQILKDKVANANAILLATPEYNSSIPGVFKNAIDWLSRPTEDIARVFRDKPVGVIGASTGTFGTMLSQVAWLPVLRALGTRAWFGRTCYVSNAETVFDASGQLIDKGTLGRLETYISGFVEFTRQVTK